MFGISKNRIFNIFWSWICFFTILYCYFWPEKRNIDEFPLAGLKQLAGNSEISFPLMLYVLLISLYLSTPYFKSPRILSYMAGSTAAIGFILLFYVSAAFGFSVVLLSNALRFYDKYQ